MQNLLSLLAVGAGLAAAAPASAAIYSTTFSGTAISQVGTTNTVGSTITGAFTYSSDANRFLSFRIDGFSASQPFASQVTTSPGGAANPFSALFIASSSATQTGGNTNTAFTLDLEALTNFSSTNALTILATPNLLSQLDINPGDAPENSTFSYYSANANGTGVQSLNVALSAISTSVPEPTSLALLAAPLLGIVFRRRA